MKLLMIKYRQKKSMLGERIASLRKSKCISQEELADVLMTSRQAISKWERGESDPDIDRLKDLAIYFNVSIDYLLGYDMESVSVNSFIEKTKECVKNGTNDISVDEIRMIVSINKNNFNLLMAVSEYLSEYYFMSHEEEVVDLLIQYLENAILLYQPNNSYNVSLNDLHKTIAEIYVIKKEYELAKAYLKNNNVIDSDDLLSECELNLGHYEETEKITSDIFLKAISQIINSNLIQIRVFLRKSLEKEALDLTDWSINFVDSVGRNKEVMLNIVYILYFIKASCQKSLGLDYSESLQFLKENRDKTSGYKSESDGIKFYSNKRIILATPEGDIKIELFKEVERLRKGGLKYQDSLDIYNEIYNED